MATKGQCITCGDSMKKIAFVVPCKTSQKTAFFVDKCVSSIRENYPKQDIYIVDSNSKEREPIRELAKQERVFYCEIDNENYSTGALWHIFDKHEKEYEYFFLIHDSTETLEPVTNFKNLNIAPIMYSYDWQWPRVEAGTSTPRSGIFAKEQFKKNNISFPENYPMILGPMFLIKTSVLLKGKNTGFYNIRPTNKHESESMERIWGAIFCNLGYEKELIKNSLSGMTDDDLGRDTIVINNITAKVKKSIGNDKVIKYWIQRR